VRQQFDYAIVFIINNFLSAAQNIFTQNHILIMFPGTN